MCNVFDPPPRTYNKGIEDILIKAYGELPAGRDKLYPTVHQDHKNISRRMTMFFLRNCDVHQKFGQSKKYSQSATVIMSQKRKQRFNIDLTHMSKQLIGANNGISYWLTCCDHFSKKAFIRTLTNATSVTVKEAMKSILDEIGHVAVVYSDNGGEFIKIDFQTLMKERNIEHLFSKSHSPWTNGLVEGFNKHIKAYLYRWMKMNGNRYIENLDNLLKNFNNSVCSSHNHTPNDVFYGKVEVKEIIDKQLKRKEKKKLDKAHSAIYKVGDDIRLSTALLYKVFPHSNYHPLTAFHKGYKQTYSDELFKISSVNGNKEFINGYTITYEGVVCKDEHNKEVLVPPHQIIQISLKYLIIMPIKGRVQTDRERREIQLPPTQMMERSQTLTRTQEREPGPCLEDIYDDLDNNKDSDSDEG